MRLLILALLSAISLAQTETGFPVCSCQAGQQFNAEEPVWYVCHNLIYDQHIPMEEELCATWQSNTEPVQWEWLGIPCAEVYNITLTLIGIPCAEVGITCDDYHSTCCAGEPDFTTTLPPIILSSSTPSRSPSLQLPSISEPPLDNCCDQSEVCDVSEVRRDDGELSGLNCADFWSQLQDIVWTECPDTIATQCPKTCDKCTEITTTAGESTICADDNDRLGAIYGPTLTCSQVAIIQLCDTLYQNDIILADFCPVTCGVCEPCCEINSSQCDVANVPSVDGNLSGRSCPERWNEYLLESPDATECPSDIATHCPRTCNFCTPPTEATSPPVIGMTTTPEVESTSIELTYSDSCCRGTSTCDVADVPTVDGELSTLTCENAHALLFLQPEASTIDGCPPILSEYCPVLCGMCQRMIEFPMNYTITIKNDTLFLEECSEALYPLKCIDVDEGFNGFIQLTMQGTDDILDETITFIDTGELWLPSFGTLTPYQCCEANPNSCDVPILPKESLFRGFTCSQLLATISLSSSDCPELERAYCPYTCDSCSETTDAAETTDIAALTSIQFMTSSHEDLYTTTEFIETKAPSASPCGNTCVRDITFDGDYATIVAKNVSGFLRECSQKLSPVKCINVMAGSIIVQVQGSETALDEAVDNVEANGLSLPSFPALQVAIQTTTTPISVDANSADTENRNGSDSDMIMAVIIIGACAACGLVLFCCGIRHYKNNRMHKEVAWMDEDHVLPIVPGTEKHSASALDPRQEKSWIEDMKSPHEKSGMLKVPLERARMLSTEDDLVSYGRKMIITESSVGGLLIEGPELSENSMAPEPYGLGAGPRGFQKMMLAESSYLTEASSESVRVEQIKKRYPGMSSDTIERSGEDLLALSGSLPKTRSFGGEKLFQKRMPNTSSMSFGGGDLLVPGHDRHQSSSPI